MRTEFRRVSGKNPVASSRPKQLFSRGREGFLEKLSGVLRCGTGGTDKVFGVVHELPLAGFGPPGGGCRAALGGEGRHSSRRRQPKGGQRAATSRAMNPAMRDQGRSAASSERR